jgi:hypothetical protein
VAMGERFQRLLVSARTPRWVNWWVPLLIFAVSRVVNAIYVVIASHAQVPVIRGEGIHVVQNLPAHPGYLTMLTNWDGQWYQDIAEHGYPSYLPLDAFGHVDQNPWAFFPLFPGLVRLVMFVTAGNFALAATIVSTTCAGLAMVVLFRMIRETGGLFLATLSVVTLCIASPAALVFQAAYSEGPALLLILVCLWLLRRRRYGWLLLAAVALSLARPIVGALAIVVALHWVQRKRHDPTFSRREQIGVALVCGAIASTFFLWIVVTGFWLGHANAYQLTQDAWAGWRWDQTSMGWESWLKGVVQFKLYGLAAVAALAYFIWLVRRRAARGFGDELRMWAPVYALYLLAATRVTPSAIRYIMLVAIPWWPVPDCAHWSLRERRAQIVLGLTIAIGFALQYCWVQLFFSISDQRLLGLQHGYP